MVEDVTHELYNLKKMEKERKQIIAELLFLELEILPELLIAVLMKSKITHLNNDS
jgi:hypothetical protein